MDNLKKEFADLGESMIVDVMKQEKDLDKVKDILSKMKSPEPEQAQIERILQGLPDFNVLGRETILAILKENSWSEDLSIGPLFLRLEAHKAEERKREFERAKAAREAEARTKANETLKELFRALPEEKIRQVLVDMDGDVDACIDELLNIQQDQNKQKQQQEAEQRLKLERENMVTHIAYKYNKSNADAKAVLDQVSWNLQKACDYLQKEFQEALFVKLSKSFPDRQPLQIRAALETTNYVESNARDHLNRIKESERKARDAQIAKEAAEKAAEKAAAEALRKHQEAAKAQALELQQKQAEAREAEERKRMADEEARQRTLEIAMLKREEEQRLTQEKEQTEQVGAALLNRSYIHYREMTELLQAEDPVQIMRKALDDNIRAKNVAANYVGQKSDTPAEVAKDNALASPVTASSANNDNNAYVSMFSLTLSSQTIDHTESVSVSWDNPKDCTNDWIGIYPVGAHDKYYTHYEWVTLKKGSLSFVAPAVPGEYVLRYFANRSYTCLATSQPFWVGPKFTLAPSITKEKTVTLGITQTFGKACPNSWLGLFVPGSLNTKYNTFEYVGTKKEISFTVPKAGIWEFRLFPDRGYYPVATCKMDVNGDTKLTLSLEGNVAIITYNISAADPRTDSVWIGVYFTKETNSRSYRRSKTISDCSGSHRMKAMQTAGIYEARLFAQGSMDPICRSNTVSVLDPLASPPQ